MSPARKRHRRPKDAPTGASALPPTAGEEGGLSAAERFRAFRDDQRLQRTERARWVERLPFTPDPFQLEGMEAVEDGDSVLVAAPTGAGKTVVGEFAAHLGLARGMRVFYTTPIKALSNQKYQDLCGLFGVENVGLLTGDTSITPDAPIVVMTTEVARNMIYAGADLSDLLAIVLDEVHYLADRFRGPVWEEVIIHAPSHVQLVALSATVSNAEEFGAWMRELRSSCRIVVSETRPVPLYQHMLVGGHLHDLHAPTERGRGVSGRLNPELLAAVQGARVARGRSPLERRGRDHRRGAGGGRVRRESRPEVLLTLERAGLLPAIVFIFSRAGCEDAVRDVHASGLVFTSPSEAARIRAVVDEVEAVVPVEDRAVLGLDRWASALEAGVAAHHAGMLPVMKEAVERLFAQGLVKVVYATETLALGVNMPARTVVLEQLRKWNGAEHVQLSPGEYTQLSGRAGRRGIDTEGHAVVLHRGMVAPEEVATLASKRTYPLVSAFRPTYNMVVNLLAHSTRERTRDVLERSFAQYQADSAVVELARQVRELQAHEARLAADMHCDAGDAGEYFALRERIAREQKEARRRRTAREERGGAERLVTARPGDVLSVRHRGRVRELLVVQGPERTARHLLVRCVDRKGEWVTVGPREVAQGVEVTRGLGIDVSRARSAGGRRSLGRELADLSRAGRIATVGRRHAPADADGEVLAELEARLRAHPVHRCPDRELHAVAGHEWARTRRRVEDLLSRIDARTNSVAKEFDRVCDVLASLGMLDGDEVVGAGVQLRRIFGERDLVVVEAVRSGAWDALTPAELAGVVSTCVYQARGGEEEDVVAVARIPERLDAAWEATRRAQERVNAAEEAAGAPVSPAVEPGLLMAVHAWAQGASLSTALVGQDLQAGDFVRWVRQVVDLLDQVSHLDRLGVAETAREARSLLLRGVVAWQSL